MKQLFSICLFSFFAFGLLAQTDQTGAQLSTTDNKCAAYVIDYKGAMNDLVSEVWNPGDNTTVGTMATIAVTNSKKQSVKGWNQCKLNECNDLSWVDEKGETQIIQRNRRTRVSNVDVCATTQVIDLTNLGEGTYVIQAKSGNTPVKKNITIPMSSLDKSKQNQTPRGGRGSMRARVPAPTKK